MKIKSTEVSKFLAGTGFEDSGWHISNDPLGDDRTLCGLAWEGACEGKTLYVTRKTKLGKPTCKNCLSIIRAVSALLS